MRPELHGSTSGYKNGCRCDDCRIAHGQAQADWLKRNRENSRPPPKHGTLNGYVNYSCRCEDCMTAARAYRAAR